jgi:hypothetical protein
MYGLLALDIVNLPAPYVLSIRVGSILLVWAAEFALCYGAPAPRPPGFRSCCFRC